MVKNKTEVTAHVSEDVEQAELPSIAGGSANHVQPRRKSIWRLFQTLGIDLPQILAIPLSGKYLIDAPADHKDICSAIQKLVQPRCPLTKEQVKKMWYIYIM